MRNWLTKKVTISFQRWELGFVILGFTCGAVTSWLLILGGAH